MSATTETVALRRQLEKATSREDVERIRDVLGSLGGVGMTLAVLQESKVGAAVSKLKKHGDGDIASKAKALVRKWKRVAEASGVPAPVQTEIVKGTPPAVLKVAAAGAAGAIAQGRVPTGPSPQSKKSNQKDSSLSTEVEGVLSDDGVAPPRLYMRRKMLGTLLLGAVEGEQLEIARIAREVEVAMDANSPQASMKDDYLAKARQLVFNLKKNDQLREDVRLGLVAAHRLVVMTSTELMAKDKREAMDKAVNERTEARMLDWAEKNQDKINKQCGIKSQEGMFECGRCKSTKTTYTQKQTRSADEPMTTFVTCSNCKNRWKFC